VATLEKICNSSKPKNKLIQRVVEFYKNGTLFSDHEQLLVDFCETFQDVDVFSKVPDLVHWNDNGEWYEICWFASYYIILDPNGEYPTAFIDPNGDHTNEISPIFEVRKFTKPKFTEPCFSSLEELKKFCVSHSDF
jgi:hypothetical protein